MNTATRNQLEKEAQIVVDKAMDRVKVLAKLVAASSKNDLPEDPQRFIETLRNVVEKTPAINKDLINDLDIIEFLADRRALNLKNFQMWVFGINLSAEMGK